MTRPWQPAFGAPLTPRQLEFLQRTADGESWQKIATAMGITTNGVGSLSKQVLVKLGAVSAANAVHIGHEQKLLRRRPVGEPDPACDCPGDRGAYRRHIRRGETACAASRRANAAHTQQYRQNRSAV